MKVHRPYDPGILKGVRGLAQGLILACGALACAPAWASPGNTAWSSIYDPGYGEPTYSVMAVSGGIAYSASPSPFSGDPGSNADIRLRAFDIPTGALLWEDVWDASTRSLDDSVSDIAASAGRVFITAIGGSNSDQPPTPFWVVRAYAGSSGTVLWEDRCPSGHASRVTATSTWVYVLGACSDGTDEVARVRAYATATGKLRWEIRIPNMLATNAITLSNDRLVVACIDTSEALVLRAYDIKRGKFLWQRKPQTP